MKFSHAVFQMIETFTAQSNTVLSKLLGLHGLIYPNLGFPTTSADTVNKCPMRCHYWVQFGGSFSCKLVE